MNEKLRRGFRVGAFEIDPLAGRIHGPAGELHLQPKVMDVLVYLAEHAREVVERETLLDQVWRRVTSEEVLTRCISELRRALGEERGSSRYIETVPKRGYRLVEPVVPLAEPTADLAVPPAPRVARDAAAPSSDPPPPASAIASVGVLPFDNHSADPALHFMGDAFATELHTTLARVDRLRVVARRSSFAFKDAKLDVRELGKRLGVDYVISGSVRCSGTQLRIAAELGETSSGSQVWAQSYDRSTDDLLAVERDVASAIVGSFTTHQLCAETDMARHRSTNSLDAWGLVQKARALALDYTVASFSEAVAPLRRALELDRNYPAAHATLASLLVERLMNGLSEDPATDEVAAVEAADKALGLAPQDPFILKMVSLVWTYAGDWRKSLSCLRKAVAYSPFDFGAWGYMGWPLTAAGDADSLVELRALLARLLAMEPLHPGAAFWRFHESVAAVCADDYENALAPAEAAVDLRPAFALGWMHCANVLGQLGLEERARAALARCGKVNRAMTPKHFENVVQRISADRSTVARRVGGLQKIGALQG